MQGPVVVSPAYEWATNQWFTTRTYVQAPLVVGDVRLLTYATLDLVTNLHTPRSLTLM